MTIYKKVIRDPIYGYIGITHEQLCLINLPVFQRLRRISQLSFADFVYPNATHNRFSHSLGVMRLGRIASGYLKDTGIGEELDLSTEEDYMTIEWAGLLHDIGHLPFSHVCEPVFAHFIDNTNVWKDYHVDLGSRIITNPEYGISEILGDEIAEKVPHLIKGESSVLSRHLTEIMTGISSIDRLDYLRRDAYHAGVPEYAIIDSDRIIKSLLIYPGDPLLSPIFKAKSLYALEGVVLSYFYMYRTVYYHHTVRALCLLFQHTLWDAFEKYDLKDKLDDILTPEFWNHFDDHTFLGILRELNEDIRKSLERIVFRKLPKIVPISKLNVGRIFRFLSNATFAEKMHIERMICEYLHEFGVEDVLLDSPIVIPYPRSSLAERAIYIWDETEKEPYNIAEDSPHMLTLSQVAEKQLAARVYVYPPNLRSNERFIDELNEVIKTEVR